MRLNVCVDTYTNKQHRALPLNSAEIAAQANQVAGIKPEWLRFPDATRLYGIGRSSLYELINDGRIKSVVLRRKGNIRGIRLLSVASLDALLTSLIDGGQS